MMPPRTITAATLHTPTSDHTPPPSTHTTPPTPPPPSNQSSLPTPPTTGYTHPPLPPLLPTDIRILSHNINTLPTTSPAELGATFDKYQELDPTILCLQECNKNWSQHDKTEGPLRTTVTRRWPGAKVTTAHCREPTIFHGPHQPGGVAQMIL
jgi:hypothetical protein